MDNKKDKEIKNTSLTSEEVLEANIRRKRMEMSISQEYLAEMLGVSRQSVSKWENGLSSPSQKNLIQIARVFECEISDFIMPEEDERKEKEPIFAVAVAVESSDIAKLKYFFQGMPSDLYGDYNVTFFIGYNGNMEQQDMEIKAFVEEYSGRQVFQLRDLNEALPNRIYFMAMEDYRNGLDSFFYEIAYLFGEYCAAVLLSGRENSGTKGIIYIKKQGGLSILCEPESKAFMGDIWKAVRQNSFDHILEPVNIGYMIGLFVRKSFLEKKGYSWGVEEEKTLQTIGGILEQSSELPIGNLKEDLLIRAFIE